MIFEYYILLVLSVELMIYLALRIIWAFTFFIEEPEPQTHVTQVSPEEFEKMMESVFKSDEDD